MANPVQPNRPWELIQQNRRKLRTLADPAQVLAQTPQVIVEGTTDRDPARSSTSLGLFPFWESPITIIDPAINTFVLTHSPRTDSEGITLNGTRLSPTSYTINGASLALAADVILTADDVLDIHYWTDASPILTLSKAGGQQTSGGLWVMGAMTVGARTGGTWDYRTVSSPTAAGQTTLVDFGISDAYSSETTVQSPLPASASIFAWLAGFAVTATAGGTGANVQVDTGSGTMQLYLRRDGSTVLSSSSVSRALVVGDTVKVVSDFSAKLATAYVNGAQIAQIDFSGESWYTADGSGL